jgi:hypothetical protein
MFYFFIWILPKVQLIVCRLLSMSIKKKKKIYLTSENKFIGNIFVFLRVHTNTVKMLYHCYLFYLYVSKDYLEIIITLYPVTFISAVLISFIKKTQRLNIV